MCVCVCAVGFVFSLCVCVWQVAYPAGPPTLAHLTAAAFVSARPYPHLLRCVGVVVSACGIPVWVVYEPVDAMFWDDIVAAPLHGRAFVTTLQKVLPALQVWSRRGCVHGDVGFHNLFRCGDSVKCGNVYVVATGAPFPSQLYTCGEGRGSPLADTYSVGVMAALLAVATLTVPGRALVAKPVCVYEGKREGLMADALPRLEKAALLQWVAVCCGREEGRPVDVSVGLLAPTIVKRGWKGRRPVSFPVEDTFVAAGDVAGVLARYGAPLRLVNAMATWPALPLSHLKHTLTVCGVGDGLAKTVLRECVSAGGTSRYSRCRLALTHMTSGLSDVTRHVVRMCDSVAAGDVAVQAGSLGEAVADVSDHAAVCARELVCVSRARSKECDAMAEAASVSGKQLEAAARALEACVASGDVWDACAVAVSEAAVGLLSEGDVSVSCFLAAPPPPPHTLDAATAELCVRGGDVLARACVVSGAGLRAFHPGSSFPRVQHNVVRVCWPGVASLRGIGVTLGSLHVSVEGGAEVCGSVVRHDTVEYVYSVDEGVSSVVVCVSLNGTPMAGFPVCVRAYPVPTPPPCVGVIPLSHTRAAAVVRGMAVCPFDGALAVSLARPNRCTRAPAPLTYRECVLLCVDGVVTSSESNPGVRGICFTPAGNLLVVASFCVAVDVFEYTRAWECVRSVGAGVLRLQPAPHRVATNGEVIVVASCSGGFGILDMFDFASGDLLRTVTLFSSTPSLYCVNVLAFTPDGHLVIDGCPRGGGLSVIDLHGKVVHTYARGQIKKPQSLAFLRDGRAVVCDAASARVCVLTPDGAEVMDSWHSAVLWKPVQARIPAHVAVAGNRVYVSNHQSSSVEVYVYE